MSGNDSSHQSPGLLDACIEPAVLDDLPELVEILLDLMNSGLDFIPNPEKHEKALRLILEQPSRGRIFVLRAEGKIVGMINLSFTISTAEGAFVAQMEDVIIRPEHRGIGYGSMLLNHVLDFCAKKDFKRITLLTDKISAESQKFFRKHGFDYSNMIPMRRWLEGRV